MTCNSLDFVWIVARSTIALKSTKTHKEGIYKHIVNVNMDPRIS